MKSITEIIKKRVLEFFKENTVKAESVFLTAFSGGPDSTVLIHVLNSLLPGKVKAYYLDHGIRPGAEMKNETAAVQGFCNEQNIPLECGKLSSGYLKKMKMKTGRSLEELARQERYDLLAEAARKSGADYICTGHNLDDLYETMIMRFFQGASPEALRGFEAVRGNILRPLAGCTKEEINKYLVENSLSCSIDSSNNETEFLRNKIRHELVPHIRDIFPGFGGALNKLREKLSVYQQNSIFSAEELWKKSPEGMYVNTDDFNECSNEQKMQLIYYAYNVFSAPGQKKRLPYRFLRQIFTIIKKGQKRILLKGHNFVLRAEGSRIFYLADIVDLSKKSYLIVVKGLNNRKMQDVLQIDLPFAAGSDSLLEVNKSVLQFPLFVRTRFENDLLCIPGGTTPVKKMISSFAVPQNKKMLVPVLQDKNGIVAVAGAVFGEKTVVGYDYYTNDTDDKIKILIKGRNSSAEK